LPATDYYVNGTVAYEENLLENVDNDTFAKIFAANGVYARLEGYGLQSFCDAHRVTGYSYRLRCYAWGNIYFFTADAQTSFLTIPSFFYSGDPVPPDGVTCTKVDPSDPESDYILTFSSALFGSNVVDAVQIGHTTISGSGDSDLFISGSEFYVTYDDSTGVSSEITYKGSTIATVGEGETKTLKTGTGNWDDGSGNITQTAYTWCSDDITITGGSYRHIIYSSSSMQGGPPPSNIGVNGDIEVSYT
jgi:hypothetical protein